MRVLVSPKVSTLALRERYLRTLLRSLGHHVTWNLRIGGFFPPARGDETAHWFGAFFWWRGRDLQILQWKVCRICNQWNTSNILRVVFRWNVMIWWAKWWLSCSSTCWKMFVAFSYPQRVGPPQRSFRLFEGYRDSVIAGFGGFNSKQRVRQNQGR